MLIQTKKLTKTWESLQAVAPVRALKSEKDYEAATALLDDLLTEVGDNEDHPLYSLLDTLGTLVEAYEQAVHPIPEASGIDVLRLLMQEHGLNQSDLSELGSQGVVSEILSGKRDLNARHIRALATRFGVPAGVFL